MSGFEQAFAPFCFTQRRKGGAKTQRRDFPLRLCASFAWNKV